MTHLTLEERKACAFQFLQTRLTSNERILVAAYSLGFSPSQIATALRVSPPAVTQMARRIERKAICFWR